MKKRLDVAQTLALVEQIGKASGLSKDNFKKVDTSVKQGILKAEKFKNKQKTVIRDEFKDDELKPNETMDMHLFRRVFESRDKYCVLASAFYRYVESLGCWQLVPDDDVKQKIQNASDKTWTWAGPEKARIKKFCGSHAAGKSGLDYARTKLNVAGHQEISNTHLRAFANCTVDMRTGQLHKHAPHHYLTNAIASDYHEGADCPDVFMKFILSSFGEDMITQVRAAIRMALDPTIRWGHFIHVIGPSGTGKGALIRFLQSLFGADNYGSGSGFSDFATPESRYQNVLGKALYTIPDIAGFQKGLESFYEIVDNGPMTVRPLFASRAPTIQFNVRIVVGSVDFLPLENTGGGWDRRVFPILTRRRNETEDIPNLEGRLSEVRSDVISWALGMPRDECNDVLKKPWLHSERVEIAMHESAVKGDNVKSFVDACLRPIEWSERLQPPELSKARLFDYYKAYCQSHGLSCKGSKNFLGDLKNVLPKHYAPKRRLRVDETDKRDKSGKPPMVPSRWLWLDIVPGIFDAVYEPGSDRGDAPGKIIGWHCNKEACREGQLYEFDQWQPIKQNLSTKTTKTEQNPEGSDRSPWDPMGDPIAQDASNPHEIRKDPKDPKDPMGNGIFQEQNFLGQNSGNPSDPSDPSDPPCGARVSEGGAIGSPIGSQGERSDPRKKNAPLVESDLTGYEDF